MDKTAIRNFAIWARNKLISDVAYRAGLMGITSDGVADKLPQSTNSVQFYDIGTSEPYQIAGKEIAQRSSLAYIIKRKAQSSDYATAYSSVIEEVAYTWFNRLIAVRFMEVNDYLPSHVRVLSSESGKIEPDIVTSPFDVDLGIDAEETSKILELKQNNESDELFKMLFIKQCNKLSEILPRLFEETDDYTELLFNCSFVDHEGIVYRLTHDIPEEDFDINRGGQVEIIGWLYQSYIAEPKEQLINARKKYNDSDIPFVTQLFTPDWIVRYMVENSLGRIWTEGHSNTASQLRSNWTYYLNESEQEPDVLVKLNETRKESSKLRPEDIKLIDPCMGSGHILVYAFDVLMQIYESEGYNKRDAAIMILENNIFGLDIDDRAAQLAYFAVMMKARQYNRRILDGKHDCHILAIQESNSMSISKTYMEPFDNLSETANSLIKAYYDAKNYGSILNPQLTFDDIDALENKINEIKNNRSEDVEELMVEELILNEFPALLAQARIMVQMYDVVVTNPPYMNSSYMPDKLKTYVQSNYSEFNDDLFSTFTKKAICMTKNNGYIGLLMPYVWMFLASYVEMRKYINKLTTISSLIQLEYNAFEAACVPVASLTLCKTNIHFKGEYIRLSDFKGADNQNKKTIEAVNDPSCGYRYTCSQDDYIELPGEPIVYWASRSIINAFRENNPLAYYSDEKKGVATGKDPVFLRLWFEVNDKCISILNNDNRKLKWQPFNKGGEFRRWYGNNIHVVNWENDGYEIKNNRLPSGKLASRPQNLAYFYKPGITWTYITTGKISFRYYSEGFAFSAVGPAVFPNDLDDSLYLTGLLNSSVVQTFIQLLGGESMTYETGEVGNIPTIMNNELKETVSSIVQDNIRVSQKDWDSFETSWDFKKHPLL